MTFKKISGLRYHYTQSGSGEPLVLLHGFTGSSASWRNIMPDLSARFRVIAVDLPGHGQTGSPSEIHRYQMPVITGDLIQLLESLDASPAHCLGYSMGGRLALYLAIHHPENVRSLILESTSPGLADPRERAARQQQDEALAERIEQDGIPAFVANWERLPLFASLDRLPLSALAELREQRLANSATGLANSLRGMGTGVQPSLWDRLEALELPILQIVGRLDEKFVALNRAMAGKFPDARLAIVDGAGHIVHLEQPGEYSRQVCGFLNNESDDRGRHLPDAEQDDEDQSGQRHLLEPGVEARQILRPADRHTVANKQGNGQQEQVLPQRIGIDQAEQYR